MNNQELNEYLAEQLFGLKIIQIYEGKKYYDTGFASSRLAPDYTENYQPVIEKLFERGDVINIEICLPHLPIEEFIVFIWAMSKTCQSAYKGTGKTRGEALRNATVEYLKSREKNNANS